jgi:hypothetical protein
MLVAASLLPGVVLAQNFDYTFVQGSYSQFELDDVDVDGDGYGVAGSVAVSDRFHLFGSYSTADFDYGIDLNQISAGLGFHTPVSDAVDVIVSAAYVWAEVEASGFGSTDDDTAWAWAFEQ